MKDGGKPRILQTAMAKIACERNLALPYHLTSSKVLWPFELLWVTLYCPQSTRFPSLVSASTVQIEE